MPDAAAEDRLVTLVKLRSEFEANLLVAHLADEGIEAFVFGAIHGALPLGSRFFQVPVQVRERDLEAARRVLRERAADGPAADVDWEEVDVGERVDQVPLASPKRVGHMPLAAKVAFIAACVLVGLGVLGVTLVLLNLP